MRIEELLQKIFIEKNLTLSAAESCTGGAISTIITQVPGSSKYFLGGVVSYSNASKIKILDVPETLINNYGPVSQMVVEAMAEGALENFDSDYAIATTGIAGPDVGTQNLPVGTVWLAVAQKGKRPMSWLLAAQGNRAQIITQASIEVLNLLYEEVESKS